MTRSLSGRSTKKVNASSSGFMVRDRNPRVDTVQALEELHRDGARPKEAPMKSSGYRDSLGWRIFDGLSTAIDRRRSWDRLPTALGLVVLIGVRNVLRKQNLYDTDHLPSDGVPAAPEFKPEYLTQRSPDGSYNDLEQPAMGRAGSRFGRNMPFERLPRDDARAVLEPNPRVVSRE